MGGKGARRKRARKLNSLTANPRIRPSAGYFLHHLATLRPCGRIRDAYNFNMLKMERVMPRSANEGGGGGEEEG